MLIVLTLVDDDDLFAAFERHLAETLSSHRLVSQRGATSIASGYNALVERAAPRADDVLCFAHQDVRFRFDAAAILPDLIEHLPDAGVIGFAGSARQLPGRPWYDCPPRYGAIVQGTGDQELRFGSCHQVVEGVGSHRVAEVHTVDGLAMALRPATFRAVDGFDEGYPGGHGFDVDLCLRARRAGRRNYVVVQPVQHLSDGTGHDGFRLALELVDERWPLDAIGPMVPPVVPPPSASRSVPRGAADSDDRLATGLRSTAAGAWGKAVECLTPVVDGPPGATTGADRALAALHLALAHQEIGIANPVAAGFQDDRRRHWLLRAVDEAPLARGPWIELAARRWEEGDALGTLAAARAAGAATEPVVDGISEPAAWDWMGHDLRSVAAWSLGLLDEAQLHAHAALAAEPGHRRLADNVRAIARARRAGAAGSTASEPSTWDDLHLLIPAPLVRDRAVVVIGGRPDLLAHLDALAPATLLVDDGVHPPDPHRPRHDLVVVDLEAGGLGPRRARQWWATLDAGGWFCGRDPDPAEVARLGRVMFVAHGVRSLVADDGATSWAMRRDDRR